MNLVKVREDMTGWKMWEHGVPNSRLTVIKQVEDKVFPSGRHRDQWLCVCSCNNQNTIVVYGSQLRNGMTCSCGCISIENIKKVRMDFSGENKYDLSGEYGIGWTSNTNREFYFDLEDYDKIKDYVWHEHVDKKTRYHSVRGYNKNTNEHALLSNIIVGKYYDHHDRNTFNNRKYNLWPATAEENTKNKTVRSDNTSGFIGVSWTKNIYKWKAYIQINKKQKSLGYFDDKEDAIITRLKAEKKYYGEFAPQRHLFKQYGIEDNVVVSDI